MQPNLHPISDIVIEECIPNCKQCPRIWINEHIGHRIICECKKFQNHNINKLGEKAKLPAQPNPTNS